MTTLRAEVTTMTTRSFRSVLLLLALPLLIAACGGRDGDVARALAGPRTRAALSAATACADETVHDEHANRFPCTACHPTGATFGFTVPYTFPGGTTTAGGVLVRGTPTTCSVGCHHPGGPVKEIAWNAPGPLACTACHATSALPDGHPAVAADAPRAECERCHATAGHGTGSVALVGHAAAWREPTAAGFHAAAANRGLAECQVCHGADLGGGAARRGCGGCHDQTTPTFVSWKVRCTMCHGGTDDSTGAPPRTTWGNADDAVRTGAHGAHVRASPIAPAHDCVACHVEPQDALASGHLDPGPAEVTFGGPAVIGPTTPAWDRATATCSSTYCHGSAAKGGSNPAPTWTRVGSGEAACGACHGLPPPAPHPTVSAVRAECASCHHVTLNAAGDVVPPADGGKHLDGVVQSSGHAAEWKDPASAGFHAYAANRGLASCQPCHGTSLDGVGAPVAKGACAGCHAAGWSTRCTMCHGGVENQTGAPPKATWGNGAEAVRVGAHGRHVQGGALAKPIPCLACHPQPVDAFSPGHVDAQELADVAFSGYAAKTAPATWDRTTATCATYCHGRGLPATSTGTNQTPVWTGGPSQAACGTCHVLPPDRWPHAHVTNGWADCMNCHGIRYTWTTVDPLTHVDGALTIGGNLRRWTGASCSTICH
ncbi:MAG TPA: CxxxxCH/CxxCH domain-containing protein [Anaeromyxobacter sp.]|nr:CxxxxCH/CxxCH domain-containing protein [Anaeromyxobacter sp.]